LSTGLRCGPQGTRFWRSRAQNFCIEVVFSMSTMSSSASA
jgi:hypothetical protein